MNSMRQREGLFILIELQWISLVTLSQGVSSHLTLPKAPFKEKMVFFSSMVTSHLQINIGQNVATGFGGAIYSYIYGTQEISLEMLIFHSFSSCAINLISICAINSNYVTFIDNHALQGGHAIYATPIYNCINCASFCSSNSVVPHLYALLIYCQE